MQPQSKPLTTQLLNFLLPPVCVNCHQPLDQADQLCATCWRNIDFISAPFCPATGNPLPYTLPENSVSANAIATPPAYDQARAIALYTGTMRELIHKLKYQDNHELIPLFAKWLTHKGQDLITKADLIIPIPLHPGRLRQRKFNQAGLLAKRIGQINNRALAFNALKRKKKTRSQVGLSTNERKRNVRGAFEVPPNMQPHLSEKNILLIDDVITTGATANAATEVLKQQNVKHIALLSLAIVSDGTNPID